jgi:hypothetical protein
VLSDEEPIVRVLDDSRTAHVEDVEVGGVSGGDSGNAVAGAESKSGDDGEGNNGGGDSGAAGSEPGPALQRGRRHSTDCTYTSLSLPSLPCARSLTTVFVPWLTSAI